MRAKLYIQCFSFSVALGLVIPAHAEWDGSIYEVSKGTAVEWPVLRSALGKSSQVVIGEKHLTTAVQAAEGKLIRAYSQAKGSRPWVAWEFFDYLDQHKLNGLDSLLRSGALTPSELLSGMFGSDQYLSYLPVIEAARDEGAGLIAVNLSRAEKAPVVQGGLNAADPTIIPAGFELGGTSYYERFQDSMGGHGDPAKLANYFAAQSLTDDVMALHFTSLPRDVPRILVSGSFHTDFKDGLVDRITRRSNDVAPLLIRIVDASDFEGSDLGSRLQSLLVDANYGPIADFVYFVNEPTQAQ